MLALLGMSLASIVGMLSPCACGHMPAWALFGTLPGCGLAAVGLWFGRRLAVPQRLLMIVALGYCGALLISNVKSVLWYGHDALFKKKRVVMAEQVAHANAGRTSG